MPKRVLHWRLRIDINIIKEVMKSYRQVLLLTFVPEQEVKTNTLSMLQKPQAPLATNLICLLTQKANQGDAKAQYELGKYYEKGTHVKKDLKEAFRLFKLAAHQGHKIAKHEALSLLSLDPKNQNQKAFDYSRLCKHNLLSESPEEKETEFNQFQSAASSNRYAYLTAWCYENGYGVKQDTGSAKMWYQTIPGRKATEALERLSKSYEAHHVKKAGDSPFRKTVVRTPGPSCMENF